MFKKLAWMLLVIACSAGCVVNKVQIRYENVEVAFDISNME